MYLSAKVLENAVYAHKKKNTITLDLTLKGLIGLKGIERFLETEEIEKLILVTNYFGAIDQNFQLLTNLVELNLSINHIAKIENLDTLLSLRVLNLSNNRIPKIEGLEQLKNLEVLVY